ncbi:hypothetical protein PCASD_13448 [Puccinia coronata f. sp. avenae]|uniref:Uncharacterized protein n=1 Tax=Puccinia coronata f. sp. avenae TaxID=200324 RepID=A0A2N5TAF1_9BASI|nr:hypothetical protein PCASD_13448 [Puccinia coronata f. sp. avenae]
MRSSQQLETIEETVKSHPTNHFGSHYNPFQTGISASGDGQRARRSLPPLKTTRRISKTDGARRKTVDPVGSISAGQDKPSVKQELADHHPDQVETRAWREVTESIQSSDDDDDEKPEHHPREGNQGARKDRRKKSWIEEAVMSPNNNFTQYNPFQEGSPTPPSKKGGSKHRRRSDYVPQASAADLSKHRRKTIQGTSSTRSSSLQPSLLSNTTSASRHSSVHQEIGLGTSRKKTRASFLEPSPFQAQSQACPIPESQDLNLSPPDTTAAPSDKENRPETPPPADPFDAHFFLLPPHPVPWKYYPALPDPSFSPRLLGVPQPQPH